MKGKKDATKMRCFRTKKRSRRDRESRPTVGNGQRGIEGFYKKDCQNRGRTQPYEKKAWVKKRSTRRDVML